jgi:hypothetical protein
MYSCKSCNLNFKKLIEYNNHLKSHIHTENTLTSSTKYQTIIPTLTISSDSLSSLENKNDYFIKNELFNIKSQLKKLSNDIDKILELI